MIFTVLKETHIKSNPKIADTIEKKRAKNQISETAFALLLIIGSSKSNARTKKPIGKCTTKGCNRPINELNSNSIMTKHGEV